MISFKPFQHYDNFFFNLSTFVLFCCGKSDLNHSCPCIAIMINHPCIIVMACQTGLLRQVILCHVVGQSGNCPSALCTLLKVRSWPYGGNTVLYQAGAHFYIKKPDFCTCAYVSVTLNTYFMQHENQCYYVCVTYFVTCNGTLHDKCIEVCYQQKTCPMQWAAVSEFTVFNEIMLHSFRVYRYNWNVCVGPQLFQPTTTVYTCRRFKSITR